MKVNVLTLFPEMFPAVTSSILGKAAEKDLLDFSFINIRDFSLDKHKKADDYPFGGGQGMVMMAQPICDALDSVNAKEHRIIYMSPRGKIIDRDLIENLAKEEEFTILCGHYEGVDQRVIDMYDMEELSIGDYILTGGELAAMVLMDSVARMVPGVLASREAALEESVYSGLLEYPQYTRPREFRGMEVPEVLTGGNHRLVYLWQLEQSLAVTRERRPEMFEEYVKNHGDLAKDEREVLEKFLK